MLCIRQISLSSLCFVFLKQDLDRAQLHLEEVRFFDVFGFSDAAGAWQCFMCNNPEKATGEIPLPEAESDLCPWDSPGSMALPFWLARSLPKYPKLYSCTEASLIASASC